MERIIIKPNSLVSTLINSKLFNVGIEGILEDRITRNMNNEKVAEATKWVIRVSTTGALALGVWGCRNGFSSTEVPTATPNEVEISPEEYESRGKLTEISNGKERVDILNSLPKNIPDARNGLENADIYQIQAGGSTTRFVMYELTDEDIQNGLAVEFNGQTVIQSVALLVEKIDENNNRTWERLIAVSSPSTDTASQNNIIWVYDEKGFPTEGYQPVSLNRPVFSYPLPNNTRRILYSPLIPNDGSIKGWDGYNPFYVDIDGKVPGGFKVNANYAPSLISTFTPVPATSTPDYTFTPTFSPTHEATATPEVRVNMNLNAWKEIFNGPYIADSGEKKDLSKIFTDPNNRILIKNDIEEIEKLDVQYNPIMILHPDGNITVISEVPYAVEQAKKGAIIITQDYNGSVAYYVRFAIMAATHAFNNGNENIHVNFGEITSRKFEYPDRKLIDINLSIFLTRRADGTIITPIMGVPPNFLVGTESMSDSQFISPEEAGVDLSSEDWLDQILSMGYTRLLIMCQSQQ